MANPERQVPASIESEEALLGACMISREAMEIAKRMVTPADFYRPAHRLIFSKMLELWDGGTAIDPVTLADGLKKDGTLDSVGGGAMLISLQAGTPSTSNAKRYATSIIESSSYRKAMQIASEIIDRCYAMDGDPSDIMEQAVAALSIAGVRIDDVPADLWQLDEFLDRPELDRPAWAVPGLARLGWRIVVVAGEGVGKTVLFRQIAMAAAQGIHPLRETPIPPCRSLIVDLENPEDSIMDVCNPIRDKVWQRSSDYDPERAWLWHRPSGINLRNRVDRIALESVIAHTNPDLVCLGPLYKAYEVSAKENDELAAREVMAVLDDLRTRYKFALLMEHHAPKESGGSKRKMMPYGTSLWLRWPEIGIGLQPEGQGNETLIVGRWRGDRLQNDWPVKLHRSHTWPWQGEFDIPVRQSHAAGSPPPVRPESVEDFDTGYDDDDEDFDDTF